MSQSASSISHIADIRAACKVLAEQDALECFGRCAVPLALSEADSVDALWHRSSAALRKILHDRQIQHAANGSLLDLSRLLSSGYDCCVVFE